MTRVGEDGELKRDWSGDGGGESADGMVIVAYRQVASAQKGVGNTAFGLPSGASNLGMVGTPPRW